MKAKYRSGLVVLLAVLIAGCVMLRDERVAMLDVDVVSRFGDQIGFVRDDAGDYSFVRQAIPVLLGRKVRGHDELKYFVDLIRETDRATFMHVLLHRDSPYFTEYVDHWTEIFVDRLRVYREGDNKTPIQGCFTPQRAGQPRSELATCVQNSAPATDCRSAGTPSGQSQEFTMADLLRSAIAADNLAPAYRGYLFAMVAHPIVGAEVTQLNKRDDLGNTLGHVYLHRNLGCLGCHSTSNSVSGEFNIDNHRSYWNRHFPVSGDFELALFGASDGRENHNEVFAMLRTDAKGGVNDSRPWQISTACGVFRPRTAIPADVETFQGSTFNAFFTRDLGRNASVWEAEEIFRTGQDLLRFGLRRNRLVAAVGPNCSDHCVAVTSPPAIPTPPQNVRDIFTRCAGACHTPSPNQRLDLRDDANTTAVDWLAYVVSEPGVTGHCTGFDYRVVPGRPDLSCLNELVQSGTMPLVDQSGGPTVAQQKTTISNWIMNLPAGAGCDPGEPSVCTALDNDNAAAFPFLTAMNIVNQVWEEVMGNPLTIPNYFPRNLESRDILQNVTETVFLPRRWSLKETLVKILTSDHFNRRAPDDTALGSAYTQPAVAKPFEVNDPRFPPEANAGWQPGPNAPAPTANLLHSLNHYRNEDGRSRHSNAVSDGIFRYSAKALLHSTHTALGWNDAPRFLSGTAYPDDRLRKALGQFYHDAEPGFRGVGFQTLLAWDAAQGLCTNKGTTPDWIDRMITAVQTAQTKGVTYTHRDLAMTVRDWLIADSTIGVAVPVGESDSEETLLQGLFSNLDATADAATPLARHALGDRLRALCGSLLESPQFLLAGIAPEGLTARPALRQCLDENLCTYQQICWAVEPVLRPFVTRVPLNRPSRQLVLIRCEEQSFSISVVPVAFDVDHLCRRKDCVELPGGPQLCLQEPWKCMPAPPGCRPGCERIDCCGGPLPPFDEARYSLIWAEGGVVERARGVRLYRDGASASTPLENGTRVKAGDWLELPAGSELRLVTAGSVFQTPKGGEPKTDIGAPRYVQVTGASVLEGNDPDKLALPTPRARIDKAIAAPRPRLDRTIKDPDKVGAPRLVPPELDRPQR